MPVGCCDSDVSLYSVYALTRHLDNVRDVRVKAHSCDFAWGWMAEKLTLASEGHVTLE